MLKIDSLRAVFDKNVVISELSYQFEDGKKYAITGASGIGKTTLINILCGLKPPDAGHIESSYKRPAYIFQDPRLFPWLTALENVTLVCNDKQRATYILTSLLNDTAAVEKYPHELSGGMKQRVAIARALAYEGDILFMDEPFRGLDENTRRNVRNFVFDHARDKTVIMITHDAEDTESCDVVLKMVGSPVTELLAEESGNGSDE